MFKLRRLMVAGVLLAGCRLPAQETAVTDVQGVSWLDHLARNFSETSMGKTGRLGPPANVAGDTNSGWNARMLTVSATQTVTVKGVDLYRMNCRGCHGELGLGAPPEINSVINPVRSTSVSLVAERMRALGMDVSQATAAEMAHQSRTALFLRLHKGGTDMPSFPHLSETEIRALLGYLNELAGVPGAKSHQVPLQESRVRIGEHIAKSTCHICHAATGSNPDPEQLLEGAIPPLNALTSRTNLSQFVRKVTQGAPVQMGLPPILCRGRMPVFGYLSEDEAADVYLYLTLHPPAAPAIVATVQAPGSPVKPPEAMDGGRLPTSAAPEPIPPVSLARFALFPTFLFLVLAGVLTKCMTLAEEFHQGHDAHGGSCSAPVRCSEPVAASLGGKMLCPGLQEKSEQAIWSVLDRRRPQERRGQKVR